MPGRLEEGVDRGEDVPRQSEGYAVAEAAHGEWNESRGELGAPAKLEDQALDLVPPPFAPDHLIIEVLENVQVTPQVLDENTLAIPDRPGNHRFDSFSNILKSGRIGLVFLVPNRNEVVRVNGSAQIVRDRALREQMAINGRVPEFAILVRVEEAFYHCGKAVIRSALWAPDKAASIDGLPSYAAAIMAHSQVDMPMADLEQRLENNDKNRLYDE